MKIPDTLILKYFELVSSKNPQEIEAIRARLKQPGTNPSHLKRELARDLVTQFHDAEAAQAAEAHFNRLFVQHERPEETRRTQVEAGDDGIWIVKVLTLSELCESSSAARRMIQQGAVKVDGQKLTDVDCEALGAARAVRRAGGKTGLRRRRREMTVGVFVASVVLCAMAGTASGRPAKPAPLFYERFPNETVTRVGDELPLLRTGKVRLQHYEPVDVSRFEWERETFTEYTWWMQMQELRFLLPAIASPAAADRRLARGWFLRWYAVHMTPEPRTTGWGEPMTAAYRAMVLAYLLRTEENHADREESVMELMRETIRGHQRWLAQSKNFDPHSNHGFIDALGLFETTRIVPDSAASALALARLGEMMARAVSPHGLEKEHSAAYHFAVLRWLDQMAGYFASVPGVPAGQVGTMKQYAARMRRAGYFLQDHEGRIPPIGDTDSVTVESFSPAYRLREPAGKHDSIFDTESGYAIYKGPAATGDCRYVVFRTPTGGVEMKSHMHADALSVLFSLAGEWVLGDAGRYSYTVGPERDFCTSPSAHSALMPSPPGAGGYPRDMLLLAREVRSHSDSRQVVWSASVAIGGATYARTVRIPTPGNSITVTDTLLPVRQQRPEPGESVMLWNLGDDVAEVRETGGGAKGERAWLLVTRKGQRVRLVVSASGPGKAGVVEARVVRGQRDPMLGWYSPAQGILRPASTLFVRLRRDPAVFVSTRIEVEQGSCRTRPADGGRTR